MAEHITTAETAKIVRGILKRAMPAVTFSVRSKTYAGGASIDVAWTDGPKIADVKALVERFGGADFDGMQDLKTYRKPIEWQGRDIHSAADWVFCNRRMSSEAVKQMATLVVTKWGLRGVYAVNEGWVEATQALDQEAMSKTGRWFGMLVNAEFSEWEAA